MAEIVGDFLTLCPFSVCFYLSSLQVARSSCHLDFEVACIPLLLCVCIVRYVAPVEGDLHSTTARVSIKGNDWTSPSWHLPFLLSSSHLLLASEGWGVGGRLHLSVPFFCFVFPVPSEKGLKSFHQRALAMSLKRSDEAVGLRFRKSCRLENTSEITKSNLMIFVGPFQPNYTDF